MSSKTLTNVGEGYCDVVDDVDRHFGDTFPDVACVSNEKNFPTHAAASHRRLPRRVRHIRLLQCVPRERLLIYFLINYLFIYEKKPTKFFHLFMSLSDMVDVADKLVYFQAINRFWRMKLDRRRGRDERFREGKERKYKE